MATEQRKAWEVYKLPANTPGLKWAVMFPNGSQSVFRTRRQAQAMVDTCHPDKPGTMFRNAL